MVKSENTTVCLTLSRDLLSRVDRFCDSNGIRRSVFFSMAAFVFMACPDLKKDQYLFTLLNQNMKDSD